MDGYSDYQQLEEKRPSLYVNHDPNATQVIDHDSSDYGPNAAQVIDHDSGVAVDQDFSDNFKNMDLVKRGLERTRIVIGSEPREIPPSEISYIQFHDCEYHGNPLIFLRTQDCADIVKILRGVTDKWSMVVKEFAHGEYWFGNCPNSDMIKTLLTDVRAIAWNRNLEEATSITIQLSTAFDLDRPPLKLSVQIVSPCQDVEKLIQDIWRAGGYYEFHDRIHCVGSYECNNYTNRSKFAESLPLKRHLEQRGDDVAGWCELTDEFKSVLRGIGCAWPRLENGKRVFFQFKNARIRVSGIEFMD